MSIMNFMNGLDGEGLLAGGLNMMAASGPSRQPSNFGMAALAGLQGYQGTVAERKKRQMQEEEAKQIAQMRALQMREMQGGLSDRDAARQQAMEMQALQQRFAQGQGEMGAPSGPAPAPEQSIQLGSIPQNSSMGQPQPQPQAPTQQSPYENQMAYAQFLQRNGKVQDAMRVAKEAQAMRPKVKDWREVEVNGQIMAAPYFDDGSAGQPVPMDVARKLMAVDNGQSNDMIDPFTGKIKASFGKKQTLESIASNNVAMRGQNMTDQRARDLNAISMDANGIARSEKRQTADMTKASQVASFDTMLGTLDRLGTHPGLSRSVGITGAFPTIPGSNSANFQAELNSFQSQAFIPMVAQLKGMGALSDAEGKKLTQAVGALDPKMGEAAFRDSVARITQEMQAARERVAGTGGASGDWNSGAKPASPQKSVMRGQVVKGYRFKGGDPSKQENWEKI